MCVHESVVEYQPDKKQRKTVGLEVFASSIYHAQKELFYLV